MIMSKIMKVGQTVFYSANQGQQYPVKREVVGIMLNDGTETDLQEIEWDRVKDQDVIIDVSGSRWGYGHQITPLVKTQKQILKEDIIHQLDRANKMAKESIDKILNSGCIDLEQDSCHNVLSIAIALLEEQSTLAYPNIGNDINKKLQKEVKNIRQFI
jgi:hypothetical protein